MGVGIHEVRDSYQLSSVAADCPHDPRAFANLLLDEAGRRNLSIRHLTLHKLVFFCHGYCLIDHGAPLVDGIFEAWRYGPVHPVIYEAFYEAGTRPIWFRGVDLEPLTGGPRELDQIDDKLVLILAVRVLMSFGRMQPGLLIDIACAPRSPWSIVTRSGVAFGGRIDDTIIAENFNRHLTLVGGRVREEVADEPPFPTVAVFDRQHFRSIEQRREEETTSSSRYRKS